jgi:hypothetical protein
MRLAALALVLGCSKPHPAAIIANRAPPIDAAEIDPASDAGDECEVTSTAVERGTVELTICHTGDVETSAQRIADGFVEHAMRADLGLRSATGALVTTTIANWTNGWEWGESWEIVAPLVNAMGGEAIVLLERSDAPQPDISALSRSVHVFAFGRDGWTEVYARDGYALAASANADHTMVTLTGCVGSDDPKAIGCGGFPTAEPAPGVELRWDGTNVTATTAVP